MHNHDLLDDIKPILSDKMKIYTSFCLIKLLCFIIHNQDSVRHSQACLVIQNDILLLTLPVRTTFFCHTKSLFCLTKKFAFSLTKWLNFDGQILDLQKIKWMWYKWMIFQFVWHNLWHKKIFFHFVWQNYLVSTFKVFISSDKACTFCEMWDNWILAINWTVFSIYTTTNMFTKILVYIMDTYKFQ